MGPGPGQLSQSQPVVQKSILQQIGPPGPICCKMLLFTTFFVALADQNLNPKFALAAKAEQIFVEASMKEGPGRKKIAKSGLPAGFCNFFPEYFDCAPITISNPLLRD